MNTGMAEADTLKAKKLSSLRWQGVTSPYVCLPHAWASVHKYTREIPHSRSGSHLWLIEGVFRKAISNQIPPWLAHSAGRRIQVLVCSASRAKRSSQSKGPVQSDRGPVWMLWSALHIGRRERLLLGPGGSIGFCGVMPSGHIVVYLFAVNSGSMPANPHETPVND